MRRFAVIGAGTFGAAVAETLQDRLAAIDANDLSPRAALELVFELVATLDAATKQRSRHDSSRS